MRAGDSALTCPKLSVDRKDMDRCTVNRAPRDKRHSVPTASSSDPAGEYLFAGCSLYGLVQPSAVSCSRLSLHYSASSSKSLDTSCCAELDLSEASLISQGEEFVCPFCRGESLELEALMKHMNDEHAYHQRSAVYQLPYMQLAVQMWGLF